MKAFLHLLILVFKLLAWIAVIATPLLGVWVASSLAAYLNGPIWLVCAAGLLLFPAAPLAWDLWGTKRFSKKQEKRKASGKEPRARIVTFWDRLILRTFFLNIVFLAALLAFHPQAGFTALATRGDWFLERADQEVAEQIRPALFAGAERLEWLYEWSRDNPYEQWKDDEPLPTPTAEEFGESETKVADTTKPEPTSDTGEDEEPTDEEEANDEIEIVRLNEADPASETEPDPAKTRELGQAPAWPMKAELHPAVREMPENVESDYGSVARYIAEREEDPFLRVKALNDWAADRIVYDVPALKAGDFGPQDAKSVFDRRTAVCAGYARLLEAMAKVTGDEIVYVTGVSRDGTGGVAGGGHAWNASKIEGKWYLIDATWNAGYVNSDGFNKEYQTNYLFTPPSVFSMDHLPDDDAWQLRKDPITRGEFVRQPMMRSEFYAQGLELISPKRSQVEARGGAVQVHLKNPQTRRIFAHVVPATGGEKTRCESRGRGDVRITCKPPGHGTYKLEVYAGGEGLNWYPLVGQFEVTSR